MAFCGAGSPAYARLQRRSNTPLGLHARQDEPVIPAFLSGIALQLCVLLVPFCRGCSMWPLSLPPNGAWWPCSA